MLYTDIFAFREIRNVEWTGFEYPIPFPLHSFTRFNSSHRHSLYFCQLCIFGGALFVAPLTYGRLAYIGGMLVFVVCGTIWEQNDSKSLIGYQRWLEMVPNKWLPDYSLWFTSNEEWKVRKQKMMDYIYGDSEKEKKEK